jgi:hypothetical protein
MADRTTSGRKGRSEARVGARDKTRSRHRTEAAHGCRHNPARDAPRGIFCGEPFENHAAPWIALFGDMEKCIREFPLMVGDQVHDVRDVGPEVEGADRSILVRHPKYGGPMQAGMILALREQGDECIAFFPMMEGLPVPLWIEAVRTWDNGVEGTVSACYKEVSPVVFFAPRFLAEAREFRPGEEVVVHLSAIALEVGPSTFNKIISTNGGIYELELKKFLEADPARTAEDFKVPVDEMKGMWWMVPTKYETIWKFHSPVRAIEMVDFLGRGLLRMRIELLVFEKPYECYLYVPERLLGNYVPAVEDEIQGLLWMTGQIAPWYGSKDGGGGR